MKKISVLFYDTSVLYLIKNPSFPTGGAVKQVLAWSKGLSPIGLKTIIMGPHDDPEYFKNHDNVVVAYKPEKGIRILRYFYIRIPRIIIGLYKSKAEYIYCGIPGHMAGLLALISIILRKKFILRIASDNLISINGKKHRDPLRSYFFRFGFIFSHYIICQNDYQYEQLRKIYPDKTYKLRNPYIGEVSDTIVSLDKRKHIAWIGRFSYAKNLPLLYKIVKSLPDVIFKIAGNTNLYYNNDNYNVIRELRKMSNVIFVGYLKSEDMLHLLRESFFLLNTSHYEGFSNTFLEAFSVGTPVLAMEQTDPDDIIKMNKLGYIYKDIDDLVGAFNRMVIERSEYESLATNCIHYMKKNHNLIKQSYEFLDIIR